MVERSETLPLCHFWLLKKKLSQIHLLGGNSPASSLHKGFLQKLKWIQVIKNMVFSTP